MSQNPLIPAKPVEISLDTLPALFAHHRARFGGWQMTQTPPENEPPTPPANQPPERPADLPEDEWNALGDPGKRAIVRERARADAAERALAAARARPAPPKPEPPKPDDKKSEPKPNDQPDIAALIQQGIEAAMRPIVEREQRRDAQQAAERIQTAVLDAAKARLHDATDALAGIDLTTVVNEQGQADAAKIKTALDDLVARKPHLAKSTERIAPPGIGGGAPAGTTDAEKVKAALADMQRATGVRIPSSTT